MGFVLSIMAVYFVGGLALFAVRTAILNGTQSMRAIMSWTHALVGTVCAILACAATFGPSGEMALAAFVLSLATATSALIVSSFSERIESSFKYALLVIGTGGVGGVVMAITVGSMIASSHTYWRYFGMISLWGFAAGLGYGLLYAPTLASLHHAAKRLGRARPGSPVSSADYAVIGLIIGATFIVGAAIVRFLQPALIGVTLNAFTVASFMVAAASTAQMLLAWRGVHHAQREMSTFELRESNGSEEIRVDFGIGDACTEAFAPTSPSYRKQGMPLYIYRGDGARAAAAAKRVSLFGMAALALSTASYLIAIETVVVELERHLWHLPVF